MLVQLSAIPQGSDIMSTIARLRNGRAVVRTACLWALAVALPAAHAWGAPPPTIGGDATTAKSYVYQYMLVGLCVALGMVLICRPSKRTEEVDRVKE
jgi:hypothetical protein